MRVRRVLVTGGAGFVGSHLCEALIARGDHVVCLDNLSTGSRGNIEHLFESGRFEFLEADICRPLDAHLEIDRIAHLACPASPPEYLRRPLETLAIGSHGSESVLEFATERGARVLLASTSEIYGDALVHPQDEEYWGNVNPIGPRSVYDESKRFAEAMFMAYHRARGTDIGIVRIFNTYGPRLRPNDGRVVSNFIAQALAGQPLTIYGDGRHTRSFCYVSDLVRGLIAMLDSEQTGPINLGNPAEMSVLELAELILEITGSDSSIVHEPLPIDDPAYRRPAIERAARDLGWAPMIAPIDGIARTIEWQRSIAVLTTT